MSTIFDLIGRLEDIKCNVSDAEADLEDILFPIIKASGIGSPHAENIIGWCTAAKGLYITTEWSAMNCQNTSDYWIPLSIINASDPLEAAKAYKVAKEHRQIESKRAGAIAEIARLQKLLE